MKRWWIAFVVAVLALSSLSAQAKRQAPLIEPPRVAVLNAQGQSLTAEQVKSAILSGAKAVGWVVNSDAPGTLLLSYNKQNKHYVVIRLDYDAQGYQARYVSSTNLNYETPAEGGALIHPNYNLWVDNLLKHIKVATDVLPGQAASAAASAASR